jgi:ligand-binding sensor domain-containing protein
LAGTENGIFRSVDGGENWIERSIGLTAFRIYCLAVATDGTAYAGTWEGQVFRSTDEGDRWRPMAGPRGGNPVHALVALKNGDLLAGGHAGLYRWSRSSQSWQPIPLPTQRGRSFVRALMQDIAGVIFAGTEGDGVFASFDEGITWQATNDGLTVNRVFALGLDGDGHVVAGTSAGVFRGANVPAPKQAGRD